MFLCLSTNCDVMPNAMVCICVSHSFKLIMVIMTEVLVIIKMLIMVVVLIILSKKYTVQLFLV